MNTKAMKKFRLDRDLSVRTVCEKVGMNEITWRRRENGTNPFKADEIPIVANALGMDYDQVNEIIFDGKLPK